jgi:hypothetical protein
VAAVRRDRLSAPSRCRPRWPSRSHADGCSCSRRPASHHVFRRATAGSMRAARHAGQAIARAAVIPSTMVTNTNVAGSSGRHAESHIVPQLLDPECDAHGMVPCAGTGCHRACDARKQENTTVATSWAGDLSRACGPSLLGTTSVSFRAPAGGYQPRSTAAKKAVVACAWHARPVPRSDTRSCRHAQAATPPPALFSPTR